MFVFQQNYCLVELLFSFFFHRVMNAMQSEIIKQTISCLADNMWCLLSGEIIHERPIFKNSIVENNTRTTKKFGDMIMAYDVHWHSTAGRQCQSQLKCSTGSNRFFAVRFKLLRIVVEFVGVLVCANGALDGRISQLWPADWNHDPTRNNQSIFILWLSQSHWIKNKLL